MSMRCHVVLNKEHKLISRFSFLKVMQGANCCRRGRDTSVDQNTAQSCFLESLTSSGNAINDVRTHYVHSSK